MEPGGRLETVIEDETSFRHLYLGLQIPGLLFAPANGHHLVVHGRADHGP